MIQKLLSDIKRKDFTSKANELMNHYCVLKKDSRYDASEQDVDVSTYSRDCVGIGVVKMTVGVRRRTHEKVQYCITALEI